MKPEFRILICESDPSTAVDLKRRLHALGYGYVALAATGEEAVKAAAEVKPCLLVTEVDLKGHLDGITAVTEIQRHLNISTLYVTARSDQATLERAKSTCPCSYLLKPTTPR